MIFATQDGTTLIVAAADTVAELDQFYTHVTLSHDHLYSDESQPSISDMLLDERFQNFKKPPFVFEFNDVGKLREFATQERIMIVNINLAIEKHRSMMAPVEIDPYSPEADQRPIEEIHGLDVFDRWDYRSPEEKLQDEEFRKQAEQLKKAGKLSGDSFGPAPKRTKKTEVVIGEVRVHQEDGRIIIDDVLGVKGLHDDNGKGAFLPPDPAADTTPVNSEEHFYQFTVSVSVERPFDLDGLLDTLGILPDTAKMAERDQLIIDEKSTETEFSFIIRGERNAHRIYGMMLFDTNLVGVDIVNRDSKRDFNIIEPFIYSEQKAQEINPEGWIAIFYRLDIKMGLEHGLYEIIQLLKQESEKQKVDLLQSNIAARGQLTDTCWLACATKNGAETLEQIVATEYGELIQTEVYGVNDSGERLVPKGIEIIDENEQISLPRPWNERAAEWDALSEDARKEDDMRIRGKEFIFSGSYRGPGDGTIFYITPREYFNKHGEMWGQRLILPLPQDFKQIKPGIFQTKSRNWIAVCNELAGLGYVESLALQLHINMME